MTKDLIKFEDNNLPISYQKAEINFPGYNQLEDRVTSLVNTYQDYVVTEDSYKKDANIRKELNKLSNALHKKRISIFNEVTQPANDFKNKVIELEKQISATSSHISEGIKYFENKEREAKFQEIKLRLGDTALKYGISIQLLGDLRDKDNKYHHWLNKGCSWKKIIAEANEFFKLEAEKAKAKEEARQVVINKINEYETTIASSPYLEMLEYKSLPEVLNQIDNDHKHLVEQTKQQEENRKKAIQDLEQHGDKYINAETGEVVSNLTSVGLKFTDKSQKITELLRYIEAKHVNCEALGNELISVEFKFIDNTRKIAGLSEYIKQKQINYEVIEEERTSK